MGCPVHIWVPMMAAFAPVARIARDRFFPSKPRAATAGPRHREVRIVRRFAPIAANRTPEAVGAPTTTEQAR